MKEQKVYRGKNRVVYPQHQRCPPIDFASVSYMSHCTGCTELGESMGDAHLYEKHPKHGCYIGAGCHECQGRGIRRRTEPVPYQNFEDKSHDLELVNT